MSKKLDLTGEKFGRLTAIKLSRVHIAKSGYKMPMWLCECTCGNIKEIRQQKLRGGNTQSCGCLKKEQSREHAKNLNLITDYKKYIKDNIIINKKTNCWEWTGSYFNTKIKTQRRPRTNIRACGQTRVSRLAYQEFIGNFDQSLLICHTCDNPKCVNPKHLFLGTYQNNSTDMVNKKRSLVGQKHHKAKLKDTNIPKIRKSRLPKKYLAKKYKVSVCTISDIKKKRSWKHI